MEGISPSLDLVEAGRTRFVPHRNWSAGLGDICETLAARSIVAVHPTEGGFLVSPNAYVGRISSPFASIQISAKRPAVFSEMVRIASTAAVRTVTAGWAPDPNTDDSDDIASLLLHVLIEMVSDGVPAGYKPVRRIETRPRGRVLFAETIRTQSSRGIRHRLVTQSTQFVRDERILRLAQLVTSLVSEGDLMNDDQLNQLCVLSPILEDTHERQFSVPGGLDAIPELRAAYGDREMVARFLDVAHSILLAENPYTVSSADPIQPFHFVNADLLWEVVVAFVSASASSERGCMAVLHPLRGSKRLLFPDGGPDIDPDVIVFHGDRPVVVIDAKNSVAQSPSAGDVYQVFSYAVRLAAPGALLAYYADNGWHQEYGNEAVRIRAQGLEQGSISATLESAVADAIDAALSSPST
jgi:hypothetical protein